MVAVGGGPQSLAAIDNNLVDAAMAPAEPAPAGKKILVDFRTGAYSFPTTGLVVKKSFAAQNAGLVKDAVAAYAQSAARFKSDPVLAKKVIAQQMKLSDPQVIAATYDQSNQFVSADVAPQSAELEMVLNLLALNNPKAKGFKPAQFFDDSYAKALPPATK